MNARPDHLRLNATPVFMAQTPGLALEFLIGLPLWILLVVLGLDRMSVAFPKTHLAGTFFEIGLFRYEVAEAMAMDGYAPDAERLRPAIQRALSVEGSGLREIHVEAGSFHVILDATTALGSAAAAELESDTVTLSMILYSARPENRYSLIWNCGLAVPGAQMTIPDVENRSDIPRAYLPPVCKL